MRDWRNGTAWLKPCFGLLTHQELGTQTSIMAANSNFVMNMKFDVTYLQQLCLIMYFQISMRKKNVSKQISIDQLGL